MRRTVVFVEFEVVDLKRLAQPRLRARASEDDDALLQAPAQKHLGEGGGGSGLANASAARPGRLLSLSPRSTCAGVRLTREATNLTRPSLIGASFDGHAFRGQAATIVVLVWRAYAGMSSRASTDFPPGLLMRPRWYGLCLTCRVAGAIFPWCRIDASSREPKLETPMALTSPSSLSASSALQAWWHSGGASWVADREGRAVAAQHTSSRASNEGPTLCSMSRSR